MTKKCYSIEIKTGTFSETMDHGMAGKPFFSVGCSKSYGDCSSVGAPCQTREEVIEVIVRHLGEQMKDGYYDLAKHVKPSLSNTEFTNTVEELKDITLPFLFARVKGDENLFKFKEVKYMALTREERDELVRKLDDVRAALVKEFVDTEAKPAEEAAPAAEGAVEEPAA